MIFIALKRKRKKKGEIFLMPTQEQLVNCVHHNRGFFKTFF